MSTDTPPSEVRSFDCPYCNAPQLPDALDCTSCGRKFPWSLHLEKMYDELKEREPNRLRATATLVQEAFSAARGGKPVSVSALKGFVTSWLLPRTVIVLGSLAGGVLLAAQTYILWNQTKLLSQQTAAAQVEPLAKLRDRVSALNAQATSIQRLRSAYSPELSLPDCPVSACNTPLRNTLSGIREDKPVLPAPEVARLLLALTEQLASMSQNADKIVQQPELRIRDKEGDNNIAVVTNLVRPAATSCLLDSGKVAFLIDRANAFALLSGNAFWIPFPLSKTDKYLESVAKFPQVGQNTQMGLLSFESAVPAVRALSSQAAGSTAAAAPQADDDYTVLAFARDTQQLRTMLNQSLDDLLSACKVQIDQDKATVKALQPGGT